MSKSVKTALGMNSAIAIVKLAVAIISGSAAMKAEFWHSLADCGNQILLLVGIKRSRIPEDTGHSFGHGKEEYFWSFVVAIILFLLGSVLSIKEGFSHLYGKEHLSNTYIVLGVLCFGCIAEGYSWLVAMKEFRHESDKSKSLVANLKASKNSSLIVIVIEDTAALLGLSVAFVGTLLAVITGNPIFDAIASILIGCLLGVMVFFLAGEMKNLLIGESVDEEKLAQIRNMLIEKYPGRVTAVGKIRSMQLGTNECIIELDLDYNDELSAHEVEELSPIIKSDILDVLPTAKFISLQPVKVRYEEGTGLPGCVDA